MPPKISKLPKYYFRSSGVAPKGQGIPDPWTSYPYDSSPEIFSRNLKSLQKKLRRKENCFCCEKKFLFECPDKNNLKDCPCRDCHGKSSDCGENCKCISLLRNWVLKNTELKRRRKPRRKKSSDSNLSSSNESKTDDEDPKIISTPVCECMRRYRAPSDNTCSERGEDSNEKVYNRNKIFYKNQSRICCCPYVKDFRLKPDHEPIFPKCTKTITKQIQTENPPVKDSKTVQTENLKPKLPVKCQCSERCSRCGLFQCRPSWSKIQCPAMHSVANMCFTPNLFQNPPILCPYSFPNHVIVQKPSKHDESKKVKKKHQNESKVSEDGSNIESKVYRKQLKPDEDIKKGECQDPPTDPKIADFNNKSVYCSQLSDKYFDHFKYLTDEKLKWYLQGERNLEMPNRSGSKFINFCKGDSSFPAKLDRLKAFSYYKPKLSDSFEDRNIYLSKTRRPTSKLLFNSSAEETEKPKKRSQKSKNFNEIVDSDESKSFARATHSNESYRANRRRRRLLVNRKRRRKLAVSGKSTILEYQTLLNNLPKRPELVNKQIQVEGTEKIPQFSKKVSFSHNHPPHLGIILNDSSGLKLDEASLNAIPMIGTLRKTGQDTAKSVLGEYPRSRFLGESLRQSTQDTRFSKALEKISNTHKGVWTASALKNIVDDLLVEKKA